MESVSVILAFGAGVISLASPCVLPLVPAYLAHLMGTTTDANPSGFGRTPFFHAVFFVLGFTLVFVALGASVGLLGYVVRGYVPLFAKVAGVLLIILGLHSAGIIEIPFLYREYRVEYRGDKKASYLRSFLIGSAFSVGWVPCVGPILGGILALAATSATVAQGAILLTVYSAGFGLPFLLAGLALGKVSAFVKGFSPYFPAVRLASGIILISMGVLIFTNRLVVLNQYFNWFGLSAI